MKKYINHLLRSFGVELHGTGYLQKQAKSSFKNDPFEEQKMLLNGSNELVIVDAGANVGNITQKYLELFPKSTVHAFEPIPDAVTAFNKKHLSNKRVILNQKGLSEAEGTAEFNINKSIDTSSLLASTEIGATSDKSCETKQVISIALTTIKKYCEEKNISRIDVLKMDTQGSELNILKGAESLLKNGTISLIYTEVYFKQQYVNQPDFYEIATYLKRFDYYLKDIYDVFYNEQQILWADAIFVHRSVHQ